MRKYILAAAAAALMATTMAGSVEAYDHGRGGDHGYWGHGHYARPYWHHGAPIVVGGGYYPYAAPVPYYPAPYYPPVVAAPGISFGMSVR